MLIIIQALYFFLPAYFANLSPVLVRKIDILNYPLDFNFKYRGKRLLGSNKTIRGLVFGCLIGVFVYLLQIYLYANFALFKSLSLFDYTSMNIMFGMMLSFGALFGDAFKSFFKRQVGIRSGEPWLIVDQIDFVLGAFLFSFFSFVPSWQVILVLLIFSPFLSFLTHRLGYYLKMIDTKQ